MKCSHVCHQMLFHLHYIFQLTLLLLSAASNFIPGRAISPKDRDSVYGHRDFYKTLVNLEGREFLGKIIPFLIFAHIQGQFWEVKDKRQNLASARAHRGQVLSDISSFSQGSQASLCFRWKWSRTEQGQLIQEPRKCHHHAQIQSG